MTPILLASQELTVTLEMIDPTVATRYLLRNTKNRQLNINMQHKIAQDILADLWRLNGATVVFDQNGTLLDGQTRLSGIIESGKTVLSLVVRGIEAEAQQTIDTGTARSFANVLHMEGYENSALLAAMSRFRYLFDVYGRFGGMKTPGASHQILHSVLDAHLEDFQAALTGSGAVRAKRHCSGSIWAVLWDLFGHSDATTGPLERDKFFQRVGGVGITSAYQPEYVLSNALATAYDLHRGHGKAVMPDYQAALIIKAWNAVCSGKEIKLLRFTVDENYPKILAPSILSPPI